MWTDKSSGSDDGMQQLLVNESILPAFLSLLDSSAAGTRQSSVDTRKGAVLMIWKFAGELNVNTEGNT